MLFNANGELGILNDPANFFDIALVVGCAVAILRYSRVAAVILFIYFIFAKVILSIDAGRFPGFVAFVFLYFFFRGIQGSFAYHRLRRKADPNYKPATKLLYFLGIPIGTVLLILLAVGVMTGVGVLKPLAVIEGNKLPRGDLAFLINEGIIDPEEEIELFYSTGMTSIQNYGSLLTDKRVIAYERVEGQLSVYAVLIEDVVDVIVAQKGDFFNYTVVEIWTVYGDGISLSLPPEDNEDGTFIDEIKKRIG